MMVVIIVVVMPVGLEHSGDSGWWSWPRVIARVVTINDNSYYGSSGSSGSGCNGNSWSG